MKLKAIWMALDLGDASMSGFASIKRHATGYVAINRGYVTIQECREDGWLGDVLKIVVPLPVALALLRSCGND